MQVWYEAEIPGQVSLFAEATPPDTVFWQAEWLYTAYWSSQHGVAMGTVWHVIGWDKAKPIIVKFVAWTPDGAADTLWYGYEPNG